MASSILSPQEDELANIVWTPTPFQSPVPKGHSYNGRYYPQKSEILTSKSSKYEVVRSLGRGTYGHVIQCEVVHSEAPVAVKILRNEHFFLLQGLKELEILSTLKHNNAAQFYIVELLDSFFMDGHLCLVFESFRTDLYEYMKDRDFRPMPLEWMKPVAAQLVLALSKLKSLSIIHTDIKPDNIMLSGSACHPLQIKLIDFGCATTTSDKQDKVVQSIYYRSPEVMLGKQFDEAIDMWSVGCVLLELYLGWPFFSGDSEYDIFRCVCDVFGIPSSELLNSAPKSSIFFKWDNRRRYWRLKTVAEFEKETGMKSADHRRVAVTNLYETMNIVSWTSLPHYLHVKESLNFLHFVEKMLAVNPSERVVPSACLEHPFLGGSRV